VPPSTAERAGHGGQAKGERGQASGSKSGERRATDGVACPLTSIEESARLDGGAAQIAWAHSPMSKSATLIRPPDAHCRAHWRRAMNYILLIYADPAAEAALEEAQMQAIYAAHEALGAEMEQAGVLRGGAELKPPSTATTVRFTGARTQLVDGPFAETKEQLGGYYVIDVDTLDEALAWARKMPMIGDGAVEVRPLGLGG
jgi:hypothetical protein